MLNVMQVVAVPTANGVGIGINGPERRSANLVAQWIKMGVRPIVCYPRRGRCWEIFTRARVPLIDFEIGSKWNLKSAFMIARMAKEHGAKVIHTQGPPSLDLLAAVATRFCKARLVVTRPYMIHENISYDRTRQVVYDVPDRLTLRLARRVVVVSRAGEDYLREHRNLPSGKLELIYNGVDLSALTPAPNVEPGRTLTVGMVAQLIPAKGWEVFLGVMQELVRRGLPVRGLIVGDGPIRHQLEQGIAEFGLREQVMFTGYQSAVAPIMRGFSVFLLTSFREGLSVAVLEALGCGLPVVITDVGGAREQVIEGVNGYVCQPGDVAGLSNACARLLQDRDLRVSFGRASRARAEELFSEQVMLERYAEVYRAAAQS